MRAILIDPKTRTITEVDCGPDIHDIYKLIEANCFDMVRLNMKDNIFVDDEGLINGKVNTHGMFRVDGDYPVYLAGKGLLQGTVDTDDGPDSGPTDMDIEELRKRISWGVPVKLGSIIVFFEMDNAGNQTGRQWRMH